MSTFKCPWNVYSESCWTTFIQPEARVHQLMLLAFGWNAKSMNKLLVSFVTRRNRFQINSNVNHKMCLIKNIYKEIYHFLQTKYSVKDTSCCIDKFPSPVKFTSGPWHRIPHILHGLGHFNTSQKLKKQQQQITLNFLAMTATSYTDVKGAFTRTCVFRCVYVMKWIV